MAIDAAALSKFSGKHVVLHKISEGGDLVELEGKVEATSEFGFAFREKGKRDTILVEPREVEEITEVPAKPKRLIQKRLKPITEGNVRQHLLDRHGWSRSEAAEMTEEQAAAQHDALDHSDLGHRHVDPDESGEGSEDSDEG